MGVIVVGTTAVLLITGRWLRLLPQRPSAVCADVADRHAPGLYLWHLPILWTLVRGDAGAHIDLVAGRGGMSSRRLPCRGGSSSGRVSPGRAGQRAPRGRSRASGS